MADVKDYAAEEFSQHDRTLMQRPYDFYDKVRDTGCPVARSEQLGGFWYTTNYAATRRVYDDFRTFSSADGTALPKQPLPLYPIDLDPPQQTRMRKLLNPIFLPDAIRKYRPRFGAIITELLDTIAPAGEAELQEQLVRPTLATVIMPFLGVPRADWETLAHKLDFLTRMRVEDPETCGRYGAELSDYLYEFATRRRGSPPEDDLMQILIDARINDEALTDEEIVGIATLVLFGGLDTTSAVVGTALWHLIEHPDDRERLLSGAVDFPKALHEFVRYASPIQGLRRTVTRDTELEGCPLKAGDFVMAMNGAANHDPGKFPEPDAVRFDRPIGNEHDHLGFGGGAHICIGQHFAKTLMETLIRAVFARLPDLRIKPGFQPKFAVGESRVLKTLPVTFRAS
jgi:cytochrome P450